MKKLQKLAESKLEKFASNEIQNTHLVFGGKQYDTKIVSSGKSDSLDTQTCDGSYVNWGDGNGWQQCDFTTYLTGKYGPMPGPGTLKSDKFPNGLAIA
ncbi:MAG: hypothetical protein QM534_05095 [Sediminibacterium sp.]|nr:hypothetical protein [Sediminibacterium sp.]